MVAGAEGQRCLDLDPDLVGENTGTIMGTMNEKPPCLDRPQALKARLDPILLCEALEA